MGCERGDSSEAAGVREDEVRKAEDRRPHRREDQVVEPKRVIIK